MHTSSSTGLVYHVLQLLILLASPFDCLLVHPLLLFTTAPCSYTMFWREKCNVLATDKPPILWYLQLCACSGMQGQVVQIKAIPYFEGNLKGDGFQENSSCTTIETGSSSLAMGMQC